MAAVRLQALTKRYGENVAAVRDLTLEIGRASCRERVYDDV